MSASGKTPSKKPYETPRLRIYGDIVHLTRAANSTSVNNDHAMGRNQT